MWMDWILQLINMTIVISSRPGSRYTTEWYQRVSPGSGIYEKRDKFDFQIVVPISTRPFYCFLCRNLFDMLENTHTTRMYVSAMNCCLHSCHRVICLMRFVEYLTPLEYKSCHFLEVWCAPSHALEALFSMSSTSGPWRGGPACGDDGYETRFRNLMSQVLHWWWLLLSGLHDTMLTHRTFFTHKTYILPKRVCVCARARVCVCVCVCHAVYKLYYVINSPSSALIFQHNTGEATWGIDN
jgi:hypothetical protein